MGPPLTYHVPRIGCGVQSLSRSKPSRLPPRALSPLLLGLVLVPISLLAACASQPRQSGASAASVAVTPVTPAPGSAASSAGPALTSPVAGAPGTAANPLGSVSAALDTEGGLATPPPGSLSAQPADLFARIRGGFMLQDVDEPAIDAQVNWFANHPEFLDRTWQRASLWLYYIVGQLEERNMPRELALLPVIESAFEPYAYSRARASGLWQFVSDTGRRFGLKQDWWYDARRDPIEATNAALDYLQALHNEFNGDWLLAIAAYNCGELVVSRAVERNERRGLPTDFWHLRLPRETRSYVPELLAMRRLVAHPERYNLELSLPNQPYFVEVNTQGPVALKVVAELTGVSIDDLYDLNPGFHQWATDPNGPYRILVPVDVAEGLQQTLQQLTPDERMDVVHYSVQRRDTLAGIARRFGTTTQVIRELNDLKSNARPIIDTDLEIPSRDNQLPEKVEHAALLANMPARRYRRGYRRPRIHIVRRGDTLYSLAQRLGTNVDTLAALNGMSPDGELHAGQRLRVSARYTSGQLRPAGAQPSGQAARAPEGSRRMNYVVRPGDTLYGIARLLQVSVRDLLTWNELPAHGRHLRPGQVLVTFVKPRS